jgi:hypothetical protein
MVGRYELYEWQWQLICDLLPSPKATGRKRRDRPVNGCCRLQGEFSTGPKTEEERRRIAQSNRSRAARRNERGKRGAVTQRGSVR